MPRLPVYAAVLAAATFVSAWGQDEAVQAAVAPAATPITVLPAHLTLTAAEAQE